MTAVEGSILGNAVLRREDPGLLSGEDEYFDDMVVTGLGYVHYVRSPFAHATLGEVDISEAQAMPGVRGVYTSANLEFGDVNGFPMIDPAYNRPPLAKGKVRFVGDIVAAVVADTRGQAVDAGEAVVVDYEPLPVVVEAVDALADDAPRLFEATETNVCFVTAAGQEDDPVAGAARVVEGSVKSQRLAGIPMEPNGCVAIPQSDGRLEVWVPSQQPFAVRDGLAANLGVDPASLHVACPRGVGGGFGSKAGLYIEHLLTSRIAMELNQPVKWTEIRSENLVAMSHGRDMVLDCRLGFDEDAVITGIDIKVIANAGAYPLIGAFLTVFTQMMSQGVYKIPNLRYAAQSAVTNTTSIAPYRGAGRPEATQMLERMMDIAAAELDVDPAELRRKNFIQPEDFPFMTHGATNYDNGEYEKSLDAALAEAGYQDMRSEQAARRASGDSKQLGIGLSSYVEVTAPAGLHVEYGKVEVNGDGTVTAKVGTSAHGQGHETAFSMIISDMVLGGGGLQVAGVPTSALSWAELATAASDDSKRPEDMEAGLDHELDFDGQDATFPFGTHISMVEVDTETGEVELLRHVAVDDCGKILNPMMVTGQQHGGIAQGIAQALFEEVSYDEDGNIVTSNLMDYAMPSAAELISFETSNTETPSPRNPLGAKGIGESGTIGSTSAIHNAVIDAVSHLGVRHIDMPLTSMKVWDAVQAAK